MRLYSPLWSTLEPLARPVRFRLACHIRKEDAERADRQAGRQADGQLAGYLGQLDGEGWIVFGLCSAIEFSI